MHNRFFYSKLAWQNVVRNRRMYFPYLLTIIGTSAVFYIITALAACEDLPVMTRYAYLSMFMVIGTFVIALFSVIFLIYTNGFLMKQRRRELGLLNVLGLGKRHIGKMLFWESIYTLLIGVVGGIAAGILLHKLVTLLLCAIMRTEAFYGFSISFSSLIATFVLFSAILLVNLVLNLLRVSVQSPVELLRSSNSGEKEPKTKVICTILGIICLGGGYTIAILAKTAAAALALYFIAVFLVIFGTYFLFTSVSISILKIMRANKKYYYKTSHFIGVSGMLHRMKRNAVGLANICILSTMVLVMVSGTLSMYINSNKNMDTIFPGNIRVQLGYSPLVEGHIEPDMIQQQIPSLLADMNCDAKPVSNYCVFDIDSNRISETEFKESETTANSTSTLMFVSESDYKATQGAELPQATNISIDLVNGNKIEFEAYLPKETESLINGAFASIAKPTWVVIPDEDYTGLYETIYEEWVGKPIYWYSFWNLDGSDEQIADVSDYIAGKLWDADGEWASLRVENRPSFESEYFSINGGFFFLGIFLGLVFIMATVCIIYYKQISEGYEDRERYQIMEKVGMDRKTTKKSISSQILVVFFAPLAVAALHVAFDFKLLTKLLTLFGLYNTTTTLLCTIGTFGAFALIYALVFALTARVYYKIVS